MAYTSDQSGSPEVYVESFPMRGSGKWRISTSGGGQPQWRRDGKELFYLAADRKLMAIEIRPGSTFDRGAPVALLETGAAGVGLTEERNVYVATSDGKRFLIATPAGDNTSSPLTVVLNWIEELKQRAPTR